MSEKLKEHADGRSVFGLVGSVALMVACCGLLPLIVAGTLTTTLLWSVAPWLAAVVGVVLLGILVHKLVKRRGAAADTSGLRSGLSASLPAGNDTDACAWEPHARTKNGR